MTLPPPTDLTSDQWMLGACLKRSHTNLPVLVVACCHGNTPSLPAVEIANRLDLHSLPNPWQVTTHTSPHLTPTSLAPPNPPTHTGPSLSLQVLSLSMDYLHEASTGFDWLVKVQS